MPYLIHIVCYSFDDCQASFEAFIKIFKEGVMAHYNTLITNRFTDLL